MAFVLLLCAGLYKGSSAEYDKLSSRLGDVDKPELSDIIDMESLEKSYASGPWKKEDLIDINGAAAKAIGMKGYFGRDGIYVCDNGYLVNIYPETSTDYEFEQVVSFKKFCDENGINLLYVNEPVKYIDDQSITDEFGLETFSNRNADKLVARLRDAGVPVVDLRENIKSEGLDSYDLFYRTDHHWTTRATLWAVPIIMKGLNDYCGYDIDLSIYDEENYNMTDLKDCWLGEQGRKIGVTYAGLDDFTIITPDFPTSYTFKSKDGNSKGCFKGFMKESRFNTEKSVYDVPSWHYGYRERDCINNNVEEGNVFLLGDSYAATAEPFMTLGVHSMDSKRRRSLPDDFDIRQYILDHGYDTVIIQYAQLMIGAHDNGDSDNAKMFKFD